MLLRVFLAFPFQIRQCNRSISVTITAFAAARAGSPAASPSAICFVPPLTLRQSLVGEGLIGVGRADSVADARMAVAVSIHLSKPAWRGKLMAPWGVLERGAPRRHYSSTTSTRAQLRSGSNSFISLAIASVCWPRSFWNTMPS
jgi:hypothetical protein